ncbi:MAG: type II secretion system protein M [Candidatus Competibacteraceae bacterium]|nr:type II secretion system protein M [Candidatus Competibacteraceae bacterium]
MKAWWAHLDIREQGLVSGGIVLALLILGYGLIWEPFQSSHRRLQQRVAEQRADLAWMRQAAQEIQRLSNSAGATQSQATDGRSLLTRVDQTARAAGLSAALKQITPQGDDKLSARLDAVAFDKLLPWLSALEHEHRITLINLSVDRTAAPGRVNARVILQGSQP